MTLLAADRVTVEFTTRGGIVARALDGVDLDVREGEVMALVGESGSGKTTLARTLMGLERPAAGQVLRDGEPLDYSGKAMRTFRRETQMVLQDATGSLNPRQTVYESVAEGVRLQKLLHRSGETRTEIEVVAQAMSDAGLRPPEALFLRYPHEL